MELRNKSVVVGENMSSAANEKMIESRLEEGFCSSSSSSSSSNSSSNNNSTKKHTFRGRTHHIEEEEEEESVVSFSSLRAKPINLESLP